MLLVTARQAFQSPDIGPGVYEVLYQRSQRARRRPIAEKLAEVGPGYARLKLLPFEAIVATVNQSQGDDDQKAFIGLSLVLE